MADPKESDGEERGTTSDGYEVGFRKPPKQHRFQKGKSGNPKGRPGGSRNLLSSVHKELRKKVPVTIRGRTVLITKAEAVITQMVNEAAKGNVNARRDLLPLMHALEKANNAEVSHEAVTAEDEQVRDLLIERLQRFSREGKR